MQHDDDEPWSWSEARRRRRVHRMLRAMDRLDAPGPYAAPTARRPGGRRLGGRAVVVSLVAVVVVTLAVVRSPTMLLAGSGSPLAGLLGSRSAPGTGYSFLHVQPGTQDVAVGYDGCQPLHYRVNLAGAPDADPRGHFIFEAVRRVEQASGLHFVYDGPSSERPHWSTPVTGGPILIGFAEPSEVTQLDGDVVGIGGSAMTSRGHFLEYTTGAVTLDQGGIATMFGEPGGEALARAVVMHELGHVLGLGHVHDPTEVMNTSVSATDWGPGDLRGLRIVGSAACF